MDDESEVKPEEMVPDTEVIRYSYSKLRNQGECSARIYFAELARKGLIETDPALPLVYGSAVHKGIEVSAVKGADSAVQAATEYIQEHLLDKFPTAKLDAKKVAERHEHMLHCLANYIKYQYPELVRTEPELEVTLEAPFRKGVLRGVVDVMKPSIGLWKDWKSGMRLPSDRMLLRDPQAPIYYWLADACGIIPPSRFDYVYLTGKNERTVDKVWKSGKKVGEHYAAADKDNPLWKFAFPVYQDADKVKRIFNDYVIPLAREYERKSYVKKVSDLNCAGCLYRTACPTTPLPEVLD